MTKVQLKEARSIMRRRPGRKADRKARATIPKSYDTWKAHPERYDLKYVDYPNKKGKISKPRKRRLTEKQKAALAFGRMKKAGYQFTTL